MFAVAYGLDLAQLPYPPPSLLSEKETGQNHGSDEGQSLTLSGHVQNPKESVGPSRS